jgi:4-hydroxyphenylpyruvate dioxygenase-like putative hemolysin
MTAPATTAPTLSVADRCDRCGAQAFVRVVLRAGELLFCGHHARAHGPGLQAVAVVVEDGTGAINAKPSPSAY